jgi:hypothetical protein
VPRIHSETFWWLAFAAASIAFRSSPVKRTGTILPLAVPFGSLGRPTFLDFFCRAKASKLLYDCGSYCISSYCITQIAVCQVFLCYNFAVRKWLLLAFFGASMMVNGQTTKPHSNTHTRNAASDHANAYGSPQTRDPAERTVVVVNQQAPQGQQDDHPGKPPSYLHELLMPANLPNLLLVVVGIAGIITAICTLRVLSRQALSMRRQTTHLRRSVVWSRRSANAAKRSADAALRNAQAVINAERSWVDIVPIQFGIGEWRFEATNHGKTPAELVSFSCRFEINLLDGLTEQPLYLDRVETYKRFVFPNAPEPTRVGVMTINSLLDAHAEKEQVMSGAKAFVIIGRVVYYDVLNRVDPPHETRYCYGWSRTDDTLFSMGPSEYHGHT